MKGRLKSGSKDITNMAVWGLVDSSYPDNLITVEVLDYLGHDRFLVSIKSKETNLVWETENLDLDSITP